jgi:hypothetical protein
MSGHEPPRHLKASAAEVPPKTAAPGCDFFTISGLTSPLEFNSTAPMSDKRAKQRQRVLKSAKIGFNRGSVIDCTIRDISEDGTCLGARRGLLARLPISISLSAKLTLKPRLKEF